MPGSRSLLISASSVIAGIALSALLLGAHRLAAAPEDEPKTNSEDDREADTTKPKNPSLAVVYPVSSIEDWAETLPIGRVGEPHRFQLKTAREMMDATHFPYRTDHDPRISMVNFQREMNFMYAKGAKLLWMNNEMAYFTLEDVHLSPEARFGYRD